MKTKHFFITLISSVLLLACSTDDSVLNEESVVLEATQQQTKVLESFIEKPESIKITIPVFNDAPTCYCNRGTKMKAFYYSIDSISDIKNILLERNRLSLTLPYEGCCKPFIPPITLNIKYDSTRKKYYELWHVNIELLPSPIGSQDDIEL